MMMKLNRFESVLQRLLHVSFLFSVLIQQLNLACAKVWKHLPASSHQCTTSITMVQCSAEVAFCQIGAFVPRPALLDDACYKYYVL